jgi:tetratricopeptide (TPR) repeat protein
LTDAARLAQEPVDKNERWGEDHWDTLVALNNLAMVYLKRRYVEAATLQEKVLEKWTRVSGGENPYTLLAMSNLAWSYQCLARVDEAVRMLVLEKRKRVSGPEHPDTLGVMSNLASAYEKQGRIREGIMLLEEALEKQKSTLGEAHPATKTMVTNLERMRQQLGGVTVQEEQNDLETGPIPK